MSQADFYRKMFFGSSSAPAPQRQRPLFGGPMGGISRPLASTIGQTGLPPAGPRPSRSRGFPESLQLNDAAGAIGGIGSPQPDPSLGQSVSQGAVDVFAAAGRLPSQIIETPFSLARTVAGANEDEFDIGGVPVIGGALEGAGTAINAVGNFMGGLLNAGPINMLREYGDMPDDFKIPVQQLAFKNGFPVLGLLGVGAEQMTVGDLKAQMQRRGFFADPKTGQQRSAAQVTAELKNGSLGLFDFGHAATDDNPIVDTAARLVTDPTNLAFFVPGGAIVKGASAASRIMPAAKLTRAGFVAGHPIAAASALTAGRALQSTMRGLSRVYRGYLAGSATLFAGNLAANRISNLLADPDDIGFAQQIAEFTQAVDDDKPLSENTAFMLMGAASFPYAAAAKGTVAKVRAGKAKIVGVDDVAPIVNEFGSRQKAYEAFGGPEEFGLFVAHLDRQIVRDELKMVTPAEQAHIRSLPSLAEQTRAMTTTLDRLTVLARKDRLITAEMRMDMWRKIDAGEAGFSFSREGAKPVEKGINPFDAQRSARHWRRYRPLREMTDNATTQIGGVLLGLRDDVIFTEAIDGVRDVLKASRIKKDGTDFVPREAILDMLQENPNLNGLDTTGYWAKFADPKIEGATWNSIRAKLQAQRKQSRRIDDYYGEAARVERDAPRDTTPEGPRSPVEDINRLHRELNQTLDADGITVREGMEAQSQTIQRALEDAKAKANGVHWARSDIQARKGGLDPELVRAADGALPDDVAPVHLSPGLDQFDPATVRRIADLEREVVAINPAYRLKRAPETEIVAAVGPLPDATVMALRQYSAVGEWLARTGPLSPFSNFMHALLRPVKRSELHRDATQAAMDQYLSRGAKPAEVRAFIARLEDEVKHHEFHPGPGLHNYELRLYRDIGSIPRSVVNRIGAETFSAKATKALGGEFYRPLAKANSRYQRTISRRAAEGGKVSQKALTVYDMWNDAPKLSDIAVAQRTLAKFAYPAFRFAADLRWHILNAIEAGILGLSKDGITRAYRAADEATAAGRHFSKLTDEMPPDTGYILTRQSQMHALKSFDVRSHKSVVKAVNEMGTTDPAIVALRRSLVREADTMVQVARQQLDEGVITREDFAAISKRADRQRRAGSEDLADHVNDTLYRYETDGVDKTVKGEVEALGLTDQEMAVMQPLFDKVHEVNRQTWADVQQMYHGNANRSTLERIANSYWFYWPISYQVKATKWLADVMLGGAFGHNTNALLAGQYARWEEEHRERIRTVPAYAAMMEANDQTWFSAQMLLPMTPGDIGVSLSRPARLIGTAVQDVVSKVSIIADADLSPEQQEALLDASSSDRADALKNLELQRKSQELQQGRITQQEYSDFHRTWLRSPFGVFTAYKELDGGLLAQAAWLTAMGPIYSQDLAERVAAEAAANEQRARLPSSTPTLPTPAPTISVPVSP